MNTWSVKINVLDADQKRKVMVTRYITVRSGLTFQEAKAERRQNRRLSIVPENIFNVEANHVQPL